MKMVHEVRFERDLGDQVTLSRAVFRRNLTRRRFLIRFLLIILLGAVLGGIFDWLDDRPVQISDVLTGGGFGAAWGVILLLALYALIPRRVGRVFRQQKAFDEPVEFAWSEGGATLRQGASVSAFAWSQLHDWFEDRRCFAFGIHDRLFTYVPKRAMNPEQIDALRRTMDAHGPARPR